MRQMKKVWMALTVVAAIVFSMPVHAHDAWTEAREAGYAVVFGHDGKLESYVPSKAKAIAAVDVQGATLSIRETATADAVTFSVAGRPALITLHYDNGFWSKTTEGSKNLPKNEVPGAISASHAVKFGKTVFIWSPVVLKPQGQRLEIVPLTATAPVAGKLLPVQVMWQGKPLAGVKITRADDEKQAPATTDVDGKAGVPVVAGRQILTVSYKQGLANDPRADTYSAAANLLFEVR